MKIHRHKENDNLSEVLAAYRLPTLIIAIGLIAAILGFQMALKYDMAQSERTFQSFAEQVYRKMDVDVRRHEQQITSIGRMLGEIKQVTESEFTDIANAFVPGTRFSYISAYTLENDVLQEIYTPEGYSVPIKDTAAQVELKTAAQKASALGRSYFSFPYKMTIQNNKSSYAAFVVPIGKKYRQNLFLIGLIDLDSLFRESFFSQETKINTRVFGVQEDDREIIYEQYEERGKEFFDALKESDYHTLHFSRTRAFDDFQWEVHIYSSIEGFTAYIGLFPWITFVSVLAVTALLGFIAFRLTVENVKTRMLVEKQTENLRAYTLRLESSNRDLDDFAYIASHDLKEPLRGIFNYAEFLLEDYKDKLDEDGRSKLETLRKLSRRMETLIDTLLEYSRLTREDLAFKKTDMDKVLQDVLETMSLWIKENKATVTVKDKLPVMECDPVRVAEIFRNLVTNAIKYNNKSIKMVEIGWNEKGGIPVFYVKDNGIGIPFEHQKTIFKIFKRLHGRDEYGGGTGSGLTIVSRIIDRHNGKIWVQSKEHAGTTFFFTLKKANYAEKQA